MPETRHYDYIIAGAGAAGLSLAYNFCTNEFRDKSILLIDASLQPDDSKTWCFWSQSDFIPASFISKTWSYLEASNGTRLEKFPLKTFTYNAVQSRVYSRQILDKCKKTGHIDLLEGAIDQIRGSDYSSNRKASIVVNEKRYTADWIFQSCFAQTAKQPTYPLSQHFIGWDVSVNNNTFDNRSVTLMDFDIHYSKQGVAFMYVLPWTKKKALFEYTIFSANPEPISFYEDKIKDYLLKRFQLSPSDYQINRKEKGAIPMEDRTYDPWYAENVLSIGFASGISKPSTGYTFKNIQQQIDTLTRQLLRDGRPRAPQKPAFRFRSYDLLLLSILYYESSEKICTIFTELFDHNEMDLVLKFLDNDTNLIEDVTILSSVPYWPFIKSIFKNFEQLTNGSY